MWVRWGDPPKAPICDFWGHEAGPSGKSEVLHNLIPRQFGERNGGLAAARPLAGPTELHAPCFSVNVHGNQQQLCDERVSARSSGDSRAEAPMVSWRPDPGPGGLALGLPPSHGLEHGAILERASKCTDKAGSAAGCGPPGPERARSAIMERPFCEPQPVCLENGSSASPPSFSRGRFI